MRVYETAFLIAPDLAEEANETLIDQMAGVVAQNEGKMIKLDKWGKKKLAYPINSFEEAFYVFFLYEAEANLPAELERRFKQTEAILRYMTVKPEDKRVLQKKKKAPSKRKARPPRVKEEKPVELEKSRPAGASRDEAEEE